MTKTDTISVIVASDNHYAILIAALLKSIDINHKSAEHIDFYIIDDGISSGFRAKLESIANPSRITIKWFKSKEIIPKDIHIPVDTSSFPLTAYLRIFSPYVVDESLEKLIYLDVDTILRSDISELWKTDLGTNVIAVAQDVGKTFDCAWGGVPNYAQLGYPADTPYFNSGVMVMNPRKWREENITSEVITSLIKYHESVTMADQYGLNVVFANRWTKLDPLWNWFAFQESDDAHLIHFLDIKPIFKSYNSHPGFKDEFLYYLGMTPWKNFKPISGNKRQLRKIYNKVKKAVMRFGKSAGLI